jgi:hypothetical protein
MMYPNTRRPQCFSAWIALALLALIGGRLQADRYGISAPAGSLSVVDGMVYWTKTGDRDWKIDKTTKGYTFRVAGGKWDGWYLTYDPEGKKNTVFLSKQPVAGSYWKSGGPPDRPGASWMAARSGKVEDWHIDRGEQPEKIKGPRGRLPDLTAYNVILAAKPKHVRKVQMTVIAP